MVTMMRRKSRGKATAQRPDLHGAAALEYAAMGWPVCPGVHSRREFAGKRETGRACSCDRVGCPSPGAHPASPTWQMQATVDIKSIENWWETRPEANVILVTGRVFDVLEVPGSAGRAALARMTAEGVETGPVAGIGAERTMFYVATRGAPADEEEWWSCGLDASPDFSQTPALRWHCRDSYVLAPPSRLSAGTHVRWIREPAGRPLPDGLRLLEYLVDACEEEGR